MILILTLESTASAESGSDRDEGFAISFCHNDTLLITNIKAFLEQDNDDVVLTPF